MKFAPGGSWVSLSTEEASEKEDGAQDGRREALGSGASSL